MAGQKVAIGVAPLPHPQIQFQGLPVPAQPAQGFALEKGRHSQQQPWPAGIVPQGDHTFAAQALPLLRAPEGIEPLERMAAPLPGREPLQEADDPRVILGLHQIAELAVQEGVGATGQLSGGQAGEKQDQTGQRQHGESKGLCKKHSREPGVGAGCPRFDRLVHSK